MINYKKETTKMVLNDTSIIIDAIISLEPSVHLLALYHRNDLVCYCVPTVEVMQFIKRLIIWPMSKYICPVFSVTLISHKLYTSPWLQDAVLIFLYIDNLYYSSK